MFLTLPKVLFVNRANIVGFGGTVRSLLAFCILAITGMPAPAQVDFRVSSLPRTVRGEGQTEVVGEISLRAAAAGTIAAGSSINTFYDGTVTSAPDANSASCSFGGAAPSPAQCAAAGIQVGFSGNQVLLRFTANTTFASNDLLNLFGVRINVGALGRSTGAVNAILSGSSSQPATNPITFTRAIVPVASVISPSLSAVIPSTASGAPGQAIFLLTCQIGPAASNVFYLALTEAFPAALTTAAQESAVSSSPLAINGSQIRVRFSGVPAGLQVTATAPSAPTPPALLTAALPGPFPAGITSTGANMDFVYDVTASNTSLVEAIVLPFQIGLPGAGATTGGTIPPIGGTAIIRAEISLAPIEGASIVRFAPNIQGAGSDFNLALTAPALSVMPGASVTSSVSITAEGRFNAPVTLWCSGLPDGAGCSFSPNPCPPGTTTLTVQTSSGTPAGAYNLRVNGVSESVARFITASLTIGELSARPAFTAEAMTNGASFETGLAPGSISTIFGTGFTKDVAGVVAARTVPLPSELRGTSVTVNGIAAPLFSIANVNGREQINFQVPYEVNGQAFASVVVRNNGASSAPVQAALLPAHPGVFTVDGTAGAILHASDFRLVSALDPAEKGEGVIIYATGLGPVSPAVRSGTPASASTLSLAVVPPVVTVGGMAAEVLFSGLAPGFVGLYQVNIRIAENAPAGNLDVLIQTDGRASKAVKMAVR